MAKPEISDAAILAQLPAARLRARRTLRRGAYAESAEYNPSSHSLLVGLANGGSFSVPVSLIPELREAPKDVLADVAVGPAGLALRWDHLDVDLSVAGLAQMLFGRRLLLTAAGSAGGASRSTAKGDAARRNGLKGGRPKGSGRQAKPTIRVGKFAAKKAPSAASKRNAAKRAPTGKRAPGPTRG